MSYTPGPWEANVDSCVPDRGRVFVSGAGGWDHDSVCCVYENGLARDEANARLIAASPDMYEALSRLVGAVKVIKESEYDRASDWDRLERVIGECERVMGKAVSS